MKKMRRIIGIVCILSVLLFTNGCAQILEQMQEIPPYIEVTEEETVFADKFYYVQLEEAEQLAYREIYQGLLNHEEEICMHSINPEVANRILHNVIYDFGEIFWTEGSATTMSYEETLFTKDYTLMELHYTYSAEERKQKQEEIDQVVETVVNGAPSGAGEYQKIKYVYEYLVNNADYVEDAPDNQNLYSALVNKKTVCAGYAKANQYLLNKMGIYCTYVTGKAVVEETTEAHAWNIVRCDGKYYYVDVTWADPLFMEEEMQIDDIIYDYLCCSESVLTGTHTLDEGYDYPACNSEDLDYYRLNNMYYSTADSKQLLNAMKSSINRKVESTMFKFASSELYAKGRQLLLDKLLNDAGEYLCQRYRLRQVEYHYVEYENTNRFVVYWQYKS